ncbi:interleukin-15 receptor subunit alpha isoform X1 [Fukomys damarensis]|uniref:interleukin-15 receptor subunit alpha isoform X1 n=1 Tax=Fukomys damarensis TaxID=885580 RepID=UPI00053F81F9|nr:interleukin-15 receptor subunit alpha isoform X1 [Fukomys damarensis]
MEVTESAFLKTALLCGNGSEACVTKWERLAGSRIWRRPVWISIVSDVTAPGATCPTPASVEHADIQVKSYHLHSRERYVCNSGFKRKAGTSSLTECVFNKATNMTHWTTPNLKCIRDPSLTHQKPMPPSTVVTARVTPEPESPSLSGKEPAALSPKSDTTLATETATVPGPWMMSSKPPSVGTTGIGSHEPSQTPSQTTSVTLEHTPSTSHETPGALPDSSRYATGSQRTLLLPPQTLTLLASAAFPTYVQSAPGASAFEHNNQLFLLYSLPGFLISPKIFLQIHTLYQKVREFASNHLDICSWDTCDVFGVGAAGILHQVKVGDAGGPRGQSLPARSEELQDDQRPLSKEALSHSAPSVSAQRRIEAEQDRASLSPSLPLWLSGH